MSRAMPRHDIRRADTGARATSRNGEDNSSGNEVSTMAERAGHTVQRKTSAESERKVQMYGSDLVGTCRRSTSGRFPPPRRDTGHVYYRAHLPTMARLQQVKPRGRTCSPTGLTLTLSGAPACQRAVVVTCRKCKAMVAQGRPADVGLGRDARLDNVFRASPAIVPYASGNGPSHDAHLWLSEVCPRVTPRHVRIQHVHTAPGQS